MAIIDDVVLWCLIVLGDFFVFTCTWRYMTKKWWWQRTQSYNVWFNNESWGIEGTGNPIDTLLNIMDAFFSAVSKKKDDKNGHNETQRGNTDA